MTPYRNINGNSGVESYEITDDSLHVRFKSGACRNYLYNSFRPGKDVVNKMKMLAMQGGGLNSYISTVVKDNYAKKW
jgi:hypothetical protein